MTKNGDCEEMSFTDQTRPPATQEGGGQKHVRIHLPSMFKLVRRSDSEFKELGWLKERNSECTYCTRERIRGSYTSEKREDHDKTPVTDHQPRGIIR